MTITESKIEQLAIELLEQQGYQYICGSEISPSGKNPLRTGFDEVLLEQKLKAAIDRINPDISTEGRKDALRQVQRINSQELVANNEEFYLFLSEGVNIITRKDGEERGSYVKLIDFNNIENNEFNVVNQFTVIENNQTKRPDLILFVNGIPLVVIELKNATSEHATIASAYRQLQTYKQIIPSLFTYNGILVISDGLDAKAGSISSGPTRFMAWKSVDGKKEASRTTSQLETLIKGMLNKTTLLDLIRNFIVFEKSKKEYAKSGITTIETIKKIASYHQYYAVNKALESVISASSEAGDRKGGVIWHTQGSGKSLSMVFTAGKIIKNLNNPTILVITDRNDLDDQLFDTFASSRQLLRQDPVQAENRKHLKELLKVTSGGIVFTTIHKFKPDEGNVYELLSDRNNIVVIVDEAHRTQYGFSGKTIDDKDAGGWHNRKKTCLRLCKIYA